MATLCEGGEYLIRPAATTDSLRIVRQLIRIIDEIEQLDRENADSLRRLLESITIDCNASAADGYHPASKEFHISLNKSDALEGIRLFLHLTHDLPMIDFNEIETGGFSPAQA